MADRYGHRPSGGTLRLPAPGPVGSASHRRLGADRGAACPAALARTASRDNRSRSKPSSRGCTLGAPAPPP